MSITYKTTGKLVVSTILLLLSILYIGYQQTSASSEDGKVYVMYYPSWGSLTVDEFAQNVDSVTHINYSFLNLDANGNCMFDSGDSRSLGAAGGSIYPQTGIVNQLVALRNDHPHLKLIFSVGGWTWSDHFSNVAKDPVKRATMVSTCTNIMNTHGFDGIDIDWEYPAYPGQAGNSVDSQNDSDNYVLLLSELRAAVGADKELSIATAAIPAAYNAIDALAISENLDYVNIMTYDFKGGWDPTTGHHTNWAGSNVTNSGLSAAQGYLAQGVPASKVVIGSAFYGRSWKNVPNGGTNGYQQSGQGGLEYTYDQIQGLLNDPSTGFVRYWDANAQTPYAYSPTYQGGTFITYDDAESIAVKAQAIHDLGLGGMITWDVTGHRTGNELYAPIDSILLQNNGASTPVPTTVGATATPLPPTSVPATTVPPTTPPTGSCTAAAWDSSAVYVGGSTVSHNGSEWEAKWWTQGDVPGTTGDATVWKNIGSCGTGTNPTSVPPTAVPPTSVPPTAVPPTSVPPTAVPPTSVPPTAVPPTGSCSAPAWNSSAVYVGGNTVSHNGKEWNAKWWTTGDEPGTTGQYGVWAEVGDC